jgi:hypothetical protein
MMGVVYQARDLELARTVALKTVSLAFAVSDGDRDAFNTRFLEEARIAARLSHPGIVVVHEVGRDPETDTLYIALEHLRGRTLADVAGAGRALPWREALRIAARVARALQHAHAHGIVHRDIKPANIMILDSGDAKVLDFGVAKAPASQLTATGQFFGTPAYMSPEQAEGGLLDGRSDVFSLGCVLYLALTGRRPFDGESVPVILSRVLHATPEPPSRVMPGVPPSVDAVVARAMTKDPEARYAGAGPFAEDLEALLDGRALPAATAEPVGGTVGSRPSRPKDASDDAVLEELLLEEERPSRPALHRTAIVVLGAAVLAMGGWLARPRLRPAVEPAGPLGAQAEARAASDEGAGALRWPGAAEPARLAIDFDHHLRSGTLEVWVDDEPVLEQPIQGRVTQKVLSFRLRKGSVQETLEIATGPHEVRVQVSWDGRRRSARITGEFKPGLTRRLDVNVDRLTRELTLDWR